MEPTARTPTRIYMDSVNDGTLGSEDPWCWTCKKDLVLETNTAFWYYLSGKMEIENYCENCWNERKEEVKDHVPRSDAKCFICHDAPVDRPETFKMSTQLGYFEKKNQRDGIEPWNGQRKFTCTATYFTCSPKCLEMCMKFHKRVTSGLDKETGPLQGGVEKCEKSCGWCEISGSGFKKCSKCNLTYYCSKECQIKNWKEGQHKIICELILSKR